ncbi:MAG: hypothetical protein IJ033_05955 [Clostridia bacterium]|nr:hypothetical protein [Clostridia bacterium]
MSDIHSIGLQQLIVIAPKKKKDKLLTLLNEHGAHSIEIVYAHGSANPSALAAAFGFEVELKKVFISCLVKNSDASQLIDILYEEYDFKKPNTGIAFTIPVEGLAF